MNHGADERSSLPWHYALLVLLGLLATVALYALGRINYLLFHSLIELFSLSGESNVVELRARETEWSGQTALLASFRDITERKRAEEELEAIYENAPLIMLLLDSERRVRKANRSAGWRFP